MNESQRRAFEALELGPLWQSRRAPASGEEPVDAGVGADAGLGLGDGIAAAAADEAFVAASPFAETVVDASVAGDAVAMPDLAPGPAPSSTPTRAPIPIDPDSVEALDWDALERRVAGCRACGLCETRRQTVFGVGPRQARWMIIGEAPGAEEDAQGEPFVGQAGRLLDSMLASIGLSRQQHVFIANVLKCRPPRNRNPEPLEVARCSPYLRRQMALLDPDLIVLMGKFAATTILGVDTSVGRLRSQVHRIVVNDRSVPAIVTYHPAYLLRDLPEKAKAWRDLQLAMREYRQAERRG